MTYVPFRGRLPAVLALSVLLAACQVPQGPQFSQAAVDRTKELRTDSIALLAQAGDPFASHVTEAQRILALANGMSAGASQVPGNGDVAGQWALMVAPDGNLLGGTLARWEARGTLAPFLRDEASRKIAQGFDLIICTEEAKQAPKDCAATVLGGN